MNKKIRDGVNFIGNFRPLNAFVQVKQDITDLQFKIALILFSFQIQESINALYNVSNIANNIVKLRIQFQFCFNYLENRIFLHQQQHKIQRQSSGLYNYYQHSMKSQSKKLNKYKISNEQLGSGSYGTVYKAELKQEQREGKHPQYCALKQIKLSRPDEGIPSTAIREIAILKQLSHPNIVKFIEVISCPTSLILVFELLDYDLKEFMTSIPKEKGMDPQLVKSFCYQILMGVHYCHRKNVLHRDLKPQNLLISKENVVKIADFGLARETGIPGKGFTHQVVTLWYRPPDVLLESTNYSQNIDIWSVGCIFAEMASLRPLFPGTKEEDEIQRIFRLLGTPNQKRWPEAMNLPGWKKYNIQKHDPLNLSQIIPRLDNHGIDLLQKMLQLDPEKRISAEQALKHKYFDNVPQEVKAIYQKKPTTGQKWVIKGTKEASSEQKNMKSEQE